MRGLLKDNFPELVKEWDFERNTKPLDEVSYGSGYKACWVCIKGHKWKMAVCDRTSKQVKKRQNCPYCSHRRVNEENCLATIYPYLIAEWDFEKNFPLTPYNTMCKTSKPVWWKCIRGHSWKTRVSHRADGHNCPKCNNQSSRLQIFIYCEVKYYYPDALFRYKINNVECDIYLPTQKVAIELDGLQWHQHKSKLDNNKINYLATNAITVISIREDGLDCINDLTISYMKHCNPLSITKGLMKMLSDLLEDSRLVDYQNIDVPINESEYLCEMSAYPLGSNGETLMANNNELAKQWDYEKNFPLTPDKVSAFSHLKVWWICSANKHSWQAYINNRNQFGHGCPDCYKICDKSQYRNPKRRKFALAP